MTARQIAKDLRTIRDNHENIYNNLTKISHSIEAIGIFDDENLSEIENLIEVIKNIYEELSDEIYIIKKEQIDELRAKLAEKK